MGTTSSARWASPLRRVSGVRDEVTSSHITRATPLGRGSYRIIESEAYTFGVSAGLYIHPHSAHSTSSFIEAYLSISPHFTLLHRRGQ